MLWRKMTCMCFMSSARNALIKRAIHIGSRINQTFFSLMSIIDWMVSCFFFSFFLSILGSIDYLMVDAWDCEYKSQRLCKYHKHRCLLSSDPSSGSRVNRIVWSFIDSTRFSLSLSSILFFTVDFKLVKKIYALSD